jgi:dihydroorotase
METMFKENLLIRGGRVIDAANGVDDVADLLIEEGVVRRLGQNLDAPGTTTICEAHGLVVAPGFIDSHVHLREPGFEHKETIATGSAAAVAGGICAVATMPNTNPPTDSVGNLEDALKRAQTAVVRIYPIACVTEGRAGKTLVSIAELARAGAVAFSDDGDPVSDDGVMRAALEEARRVNRPIFPHEEVKALTEGGSMHEGAVSARLGFKGMPAAGEEEMIARDIDLVRQTGGPLHIAHISTAGAVELVRRAKEEGLPVTCEVLTHHFALTDEEVDRRGTDAKMSPPLRGEADVAAMIRGLADNTIDTIATDHAPHTAIEKQLPFEEAPMGIVGLETAVGLTLTHLVHTGALPLMHAVDKWTRMPADILRLPGGRFNSGCLGDVTIIDPDLLWTVNAETFRSKSRNTPFDGCQMRGKAVVTVVGGRIVHDER